MQNVTPVRENYLDHARGFIILVVCLQHALQPYAQMWGGSLYFHPAIIERDSFFDGIFMLTDSFIMQALFLIAGMFVLPSLNRRGWLSFTKEKVIRLMIPFFVAIYTLAPMLRYFKHIETIDPTTTYLDFWLKISFENISYAGYWFLSFLLWLTFIVAILKALLPFVISWLGKAVGWMAKNPIFGFMIFGGLSATMITIFDMMHGTQFWLTWKSVFLASRWNMALSYVLFFLIGVGIRESGLLANEEFMEKMRESWGKWVGLTVILGLAYFSYVQIYDTDTFNLEIARHFYVGGDLEDAWPLIWGYGPGIAVRTVMHGFYCVAVTIAIITTLYKFTNEKQGLWTSLGACSYGIYFFHEQLVVWMQYWLIDVDLALLLKIIIGFVFSVAGSWLFTDKLMRKVFPFNRAF